MSGEDVLAAFLGARPERSMLDAHPDLGAKLSALLADARHAFPSVRCAASEYAAHLGRVIGEGEPMEQLARLATRDLYLAHAAAHRDDAALRLVEEQCIAPLRSALRRGDTPDDVVCDALQSLRMQLLVGSPASPPRLLSYAGRGSLKSWVRVAATRVLINSKRGPRRESLDDDLRLSDRADVEDLELAGLKQAYKREFHESFREALATLSPRARNLLRQHYLDALTMEQIGALYQAHRITVHRWIDAAREELALATRARLATRMRLEGPEVESVLRLIHSQMGNSFRAFMEKAREVE